MIEIGDWVESLRDFADVDKGTYGLVVEDYGTGFTIAWDSISRPVPTNMSPKEISMMRVTDLNSPLMDGFNKEFELHWLKKLDESPFKTT